MAVERSWSGWLSKVHMDTARLEDGIKKGWSFMRFKDVRFLKGLTRIKEERRPGVYGSAMRKSGVISLAPDALKQDWLLWASATLHEAEHAIKGTLEREALSREFEFLGEVYRRAMNLQNEPLMKNAIRNAIIAERQWKVDVEMSKDEDHITSLVDKGFTPEAAAIIAGGGQ